MFPWAAGHVRVGRGFRLAPPHRTKQTTLCISHDAERVTRLAAATQRSEWNGAATLGPAQREAFSLLITALAFAQCESFRLLNARISLLPDIAENCENYAICERRECM